jgi:phosphoadenylyl-sulfate reductase (thioredoxin)
MEASMQWLETAPDAPRLNVTTPLEEVQAAARGADQLILEFDAFRDGRGFSLAAVLRERGYRGRLIAAGKLIPDQARHLRRSGFDAVVIGANADAEAWRRMDSAFTAAYQPAEDPALPVWRRRAAGHRPSGLAAPSQTLVDDLNRLVEGYDAEDVLAVALDRTRGLRAAVLSSFGADSAVLLSMVAKLDPATPVLFLDTGMHFLQTLFHRDALSKRLGLSDIRLLTPDAGERAGIDPKDDLWRTDTDACCDLRKVRPLQQALSGFELVITGRRSDQTAERHGLKAFELFEGRIRVNPLANWTHADLEARAAAEDLPAHPLVEQGYRSIGCWPCTRAVEAGEDARAGRWSGSEKTECGIHLGRRPEAVA